MSVYVLHFNCPNHATYEDYYNNEYFVGVFSSLEKAKEWIDNDIPKIIEGREKEYNVYDFNEICKGEVWEREVLLSQDPTKNYYWECDYCYRIEKVDLDSTVVCPSIDLRKGY